MKIFITGVSSGLGKVLAEELVNRGYQVWGIARQKLLLENLVSRLTKEKFYYSICDISKPEDVERVVSEMKYHQFEPDVVILNAAIIQPDISSEFEYDKFEETMRVNLFGAMIWVKKFLPDFKRKGRGTFVAVSSFSAYKGLKPKGVGYSTSKVALSMAFECLRLHLGIPGVRFVTVYLGRLQESKHWRELTTVKTKTAAIKIIGLFESEKNILKLPTVASIVFRILRELPETFLKKFVLRNK